jgi:hypothetical protein
MGLALDLINICLQGIFICQPPDPPPIQYYEQGKACYINGTFHESCPNLTKPYVSVYNQPPYTKIK